MSKAEELKAKAQAARDALRKQYIAEEKSRARKEASDRENWISKNSPIAWAKLQSMLSEVAGNGENYCYFCPHDFDSDHRDGTDFFERMCEDFAKKLKEDGFSTKYDSRESVSSEGQYSVLEHLKVTW
jgi:hypothetical protein